MEMMLKKSSDGWYTIVRAAHDGREWLEQLGPNESRLMCSERLSPEACIEGPADHMIALAYSIRRRHDILFKRCAVRFVHHGVHLWSPKNSDGEVVVSLKQADDLATQIIAMLVPGQTGGD